MPTNLADHGTGGRIAQILNCTYYPSPFSPTRRIEREGAYEEPFCLRIYPPNNKETKPLLEKLLAEGGEDTKLYYNAKIQSSRIILNQVRPEPNATTTIPSLSERADRIISIIAQQGGASTWSTVREKLGLPPEKMPGPFLVKALKERGLQTTRNPKTSTMTWKLVDKSKLNGWLPH